MSTNKKIPLIKNTCFGEINTAIVSVCKQGDIAQVKEYLYTCSPEVRDNLLSIALEESAQTKEPDNRYESIITLLRDNP